MSLTEKFSTKRSIVTGAVFALAGANLVALGPATASTTCASVSATEISTGICEVAFEEAGDDTWTPPANVDSLQALLVGGGGASVDGGFGGGGQLSFVTALDPDLEVEITVGAGTGTGNFGGATSVSQATTPSVITYVSQGGRYGNGSASDSGSSFEFDVDPIQGDPLATYRGADDDEVSGAGTKDSFGAGILPSAAALELETDGVDPLLWPSGVNTDLEYGQGGSNGATHPAGGGAATIGGTLVAGQVGIVLFRFTLSELVPETPSAPAPYSGPIITSVDSAIGASSVTQGTKAVISGSRLSSVTKVVIDGIEITVDSATESTVSFTLPQRLEAGSYDVSIQSSLGNLTYLGGLVVTASEVTGETKYWVKRISDTEAKVYLKYPELDKTLRISHQSGGVGSYETIFVGTISSLEDDRLISNSEGVYIVRTINLDSKINRIRVTVGDEKPVQVRYNR